MSFQLYTLLILMLGDEIVMAVSFSLLGNCTLFTKNPGLSMEEEEEGFFQQEYLFFDLYLLVIQSKEYVH